MAKDAIIFQPREKDTSSGITRKTLKRLASALDVPESEVIHRALAKYAQENLPRYEPDDSPLTKDQHCSIAAQIRRQHGGMKTIETLFISACQPLQAGESGPRRGKKETSVLMPRAASGVELSKPLLVRRPRP